MPDDTGPVGYNPLRDSKTYLQSKKMDLEAGWFGRVFGSPERAPQNIAFVIVMSLVLSGVVFGLYDPTDRMEFWKLLLPVITLTLGYLFGRNASH